MGKTLGKWIRCIFFGKDKIKSISSKCLKNSSFEKASSTLPQKPLDSLVVIQPSLISDPAPINAAGGYGKTILEQNGMEVSESLIAEPTLSSFKQGGDAMSITKPGVQLESEKHMLEQATTRVQAAFRGYRARREFYTLKSIIRLQALIRGHLVRRKGVASTDHSRSEQEKILNLIDQCQQDPKTIFNFATDIPCWSEVKTEKPRRKQWNLPKSPLHLFSGQKIINPPQDIRANECGPSISIKEDQLRTLPVGDDPAIFLSNHVMPDAWNKHVSLLNEKNKSKETWIGKQNQKTRNLRDPLPKKQHGPPAIVPLKVQVKGQATPRIEQDVAGNDFITRQFGKDVANSRVVTRHYSSPSFDSGTENASPKVQWPGKKVQGHNMATKFAKVKVKGHTSQRFVQDVDGNRFLTRRKSLPLAGNGKPDASPQVGCPIESSGISGTRLDTSLSSSKGSLIQPEWKF